MALRVLAVDDSRTIRELVNLTLSEAGFETVFAEDGQHGLDILDTAKPDVILTDINMPKLDGFGFIEAIRARKEHERTPILVLTTESGDDLKQRARRAGATGWIVKPFEGPKLVRALELVSG